MERNAIAEELIGTTDQTLGQKDIGQRARKKGSNSFVRERKLTGKRLILLILSGIKLALQLATDELFLALGHAEEAVSKQAVSKARGNLDPDFVKSIFTDCAKIGSDFDDMELYKGKYRLVAMDASDVALDNAQAVKDYFGCSGRNKDAATGMLSMAYDPLNDWILDASLHPYKTDERPAGKENILALEGFPGTRSNLYIYDRGYNSKEFLAWMEERHHKFLMRVREKFDLDFDAAPGNGEWVCFDWKEKTYRVRVIKLTLSSGVVETLITNLSEKTLPTAQAGHLYFKRWRIEVKFNLLKEKLQLENMSGRRPVTIFQDLWATLYIANLCAAIKWRSDAAINAKTSGADNKYAQTTNQNRLIRKFRDRFIKCLLAPPQERSRLLDLLVADVARYPVEVKPDRSFPRSLPRAMRFCDRHKAVVP